MQRARPLNEAGLLRERLIRRESVTWPAFILGCVEPDAAKQVGERKDIHEQLEETEHGTRGEVIGDELDVLEDE